MSWTLDPRYVPANVKWAKKAPTHLGDTIAALQGRPRDVSTIKARPTTLSERLASAIVPDGRKWTDLRNKVSGAVDALTPLGAEQPLRDARSAYQSGNKWGAAGLGALAMLGAVPGVGTEAKAGTKAAKGIFGKRGIIAYHGSPHSFDKFSLDKIGTGEGAQAYGHGLYFAENEDVARGYRDSLTNAATDGNPSMRVGNRSLLSMYTDLDKQAVRLPFSQAQGHYDKMALLEDLMHGGDVQHIRQQAANGAYDKPLMDWYEQNIAPHFNRDGSMYQVRINANPEDFLDWDKPLSGPDQAEALAAKFDSVDPVMRKTLEDWTYENSRRNLPMPDGQDIVAKFGGVTGANSAALSQNLKSAGIPGIKYLDQGSRGAGDGSRNYVVFDDALIEILKKYGIAVPAMGLGIAGMSRQPEGGM